MSFGVFTEFRMRLCAVKAFRTVAGEVQIVFFIGCFILKFSESDRTIRANLLKAFLFF